MSHTYEDRLIRVLHYIHDHPDGDLSLDTLADVAAMSRFHWHRVYHAMTGETCAQTVRRMRLHRAAGRLVREDTPVERIAHGCGYDNVKSFAHAFRSTYGLTPAAFRKSGRLDAPALTLREKGHLMHPIDIRDMPARQVIGIPHIGPYMTIGKAFEELGARLASRGLFAQCGPVLAIYRDDPSAVPEDQLRSLAGAEWRGADLPEGFDPDTIPASRAAVMTFKGPYAQIKSGYDQLYGSWLPESGEEPGDGPCYEIYLNDPRTTPPEELLTEICLPLAPR
ncbi:AraC family transcriptional regulator [Aliiroseovarius sp.]|uniref:AraC family transcriptional regulator n=1 Tax=Aliiroseovarius sp. TaxID=1872442 RepID=UPI003BACB8AD